MKIRSITMSLDEQDPSRTRLNELFVHSLQEGAYNMCLVQTPNHATQILVQSVGCNLTLFQGMRKLKRILMK